VPTLCQTVADGDGEFDGTAGRGLFDFSFLNGIPRTTRVVLTSLAYSSGDLSGSTAGSVSIVAQKPGGTLSERILLGSAIPASTLDPTLRTENVKFCGVVLPRDPPDVGGFGSPNGAHWIVEGYTRDKEAEGTICIDYVLEPFPDTDERDSGSGAE